MPDHKEIYRQQAEQYESLVSKEDYQENIPRALLEIHPFEGCNVVELGAGTGRLTRLLAPLANTIWALDISGHMLGVAAKTLQAKGSRNWKMAVADHRNIPLANAVADVVISGWSVGCLAAWSGKGWRKEISKVIGEIERVLQDKGMIILVETLGTGYKEPEILASLRGYYDYLEEIGFSKKWIRTDFEFESLEQAAELIGFFFGEEMAARVKDEAWVRVPECTGIWWRSI